MRRDLLAMKSTCIAGMLILGCSSGQTIPKSDVPAVAHLDLSGVPTVTITNPTSSVWLVGVFPTLHPAQPQPPSGIVSLGFVQPHSSLCAALTPVTLIGTNVTTGRVDTIPGVRADTIMLSVVDTSTNNLGYTPTFVPANSTSWSVSIADPQHLAIPTDIPCNPAK